MALAINASQERNLNSNGISTVKILVKFLNKVYGAVGEFTIDDNGTTKCLFFQDPSMKDLFNFYPERICIDIICRQFEIELNMFSFMCEDSNGRNCIIALGFLKDNDVESFVWLLNIFKKHNPNWRKIKSLAVDPDIKAREIVRELFPQSLMMICYFHAYALFKNSLSDLKDISLITEEQRLHANDLFKHLYHAQNQSEFELHYSLFLNLPAIIVSYFQEIWMPKQHEWRIPFDFAHENVFMNLNVFLQEFNDATRSIAFSETSYIEYIKKMFLYIQLKKKEKPSIFLQPVSFLYSRFSPEYQISKSLTPYAAKFVIEQLHLSFEISTDVNAASDTYIFDYLGMSVSASSIACSCHFFLFTLLPCRHVFAVRKIKNLCVFDESLIDNSWSMEYYQHTIVCMQSYITQGTDSRIPEDLMSRKNLAIHLFEVSTSCILHSPKAVFQSRFKVLQKLVQAWKVGEDVSLKFLEVKDTSDRVQSSTLAMSNSSQIPVISPASCFPFISYSAASCSSITSPSPDLIDSIISNGVHSCSLKPSISPCSSGHPDSIPSSSILPSTSPIPFSSNVQSSPVVTPISHSFINIPNSSNDCSTIPSISIVSESQNPNDPCCSKMCNISENVSSSQETINSNEVSISHKPRNHKVQEKNPRQVLTDFNTSVINSTCINMAYISYIICSSKISAVEWLRQKGFLATSMKCPVCCSAMISKIVFRLSDGVVWSCNKIGENRKCCSKRCSVRVGSFFELANMTLEQILIFCYMWINKFGKSRIMSETNSSASNYTTLNKFCNRVCEDSIAIESSLNAKDHSPGFRSALDRWLEFRIEEDTLIKFLIDATSMYKKDSMKTFKNDPE